jgi:hypothetical protein
VDFGPACIDAVLTAYCAAAHSVAQEKPDPRPFAEHLTFVDQIGEEGSLPAQPYRDDRASKFTTAAAVPFEEAGFCPVTKLPSVNTWD